MKLSIIIVIAWTSACRPVAVDGGTVERSQPSVAPTHSAGIAAEMIYIPGGSFDGHVIGAFYFDRTEVTVAAYERCIETRSCRVPEQGLRCSSGQREHPINCVRASDAATYCAWADKRLPTEWEWEWAARGRDEGRRYPWGNRRPTCKLTVMDGGTRKKRQSGCGREAEWPVGSKPLDRSRDGVLDLAGNVSEWTSSTESDGDIITRGGCWSYQDPENFRVSARVILDPSLANIGYGFRCAWSP
jgi:formylglycine-generating enzyme required for sulfatase activity